MVTKNVGWLAPSGFSVPPGANPIVMKVVPPGTNPGAMKVVLPGANPSATKVVPAKKIRMAVRGGVGWRGKEATLTVFTALRIRMCGCY